ncbi:MAG TPA: hypothetical protein VN695_20165 [Streptosporangiaceae bacterium]|nr:hypothetical protein [Streptosporangiaceae bacterium]
MSQIWDAGGEAGAALTHVVEGFGVPVLGRPDMLEGLLKDDVPQLPREVAMLTEAARFGVADQLADRVQQGVAAQSAVAMVANEMTSRTAVDATGALWAAGAFARVIGYQVAGPPIAQAPDLQSQDTMVPTPVPVQLTAVEPQAGPPDPVPTRVADDVAPATRRLDAALGSDGQTIRAEGVTIPPRGDYVQTGPPPYLVRPGSQNLGIPAALATGLMLAMLMFWALSSITHADTVKAWTTLLPLAAGGAAIAIAAARGRSGGAGFAAVLGLVVPAVSFAIYDTVIAAELTFLSSAKRHVIEATSIVALLAAITAAAVAIAGLQRWRQLGRQQPDALSVVVSIVAVCFPFASIFGQLKTSDGVFGNVLGSGVHGWFILWGLIFLVAFALPPVVAAFLPPGSNAQLAIWAGWLLIVLAWQISDSPTDGVSAAYGLYLTWIVWLLVALGTVALALRGPIGPRLDPSPGPGQAPLR